MSILQDLFNAVLYFKPWEIVYEYQQGLHFRKGVTKEKKIKWARKDLENIVKEEKKTINQLGGGLKVSFSTRFLPEKHIKYPQGYMKNWLGLPRHSKRYKNLKDDELEQIVREEKKVIKDAGGYLSLIFADNKINLPEGYKRSWVTGFPKHKKRYEKLSFDEKEKIDSEEKEVVRQNGGYLSLLIPSVFPVKHSEFPKGYGRKRLSGLPKHGKRYETSKILRPGLYWKIPIIDDIVKAVIKERCDDIGNVSIPTSKTDDSVRSVNISAKVRYELADFHRADMEVEDYQNSLKEYTLVLLGKHGWGKPWKDWRDPVKIEEMEKKMLEELRKLVTDKWGIKVHNLKITDCIPSTTRNVQRIMYEGQAPPVSPITPGNYPPTNNEF